MFTLVRFDDDSLGVYPSKNITKSSNGKYTVKHKGCKYEADFIISNESREYLNKIKKDTFKSAENITNNNDETKMNQSHLNLTRVLFDTSRREIIHANESDTSKTFEDNMNDISSFVTSSLNSCSIGSEDIEGSIAYDTTNNVLSFTELENIECTTDIPPEENFSAREDTLGTENRSVDGDIQQTDMNGKICGQLYGPEGESPNVHFPNYDSDDDDNDSLYEPEEAFDEESNNNDVPTVEITSTPKLPRNMNPKLSSDSLKDASASICDDVEMFVDESRGKKGDKKANFCCYCQTKQQKIARHLETVHKNEEEVKKFIHLPKGHIERRKLIANVRNNGNFIFNTMKQYNDGEMIVSRRPSKDLKRSGIDFKSCPNCKAFFSKNTLRVHFRKCNGETTTVKRITQILSRKVTGRVHTRASNVVKKQLMPLLREDDITRLIRFDELVIIYANKMTEKYRNPRHFDMIRQRMRLIGRFLSIMKRINKEVTDLSSIFDPRFTDDTFIAINEAARFNAVTNNYEAPTVAFNIGSLLKQIGNFLMIECIKTHQDDKRKNTKNFMKLLVQEINISVNRNVTELQVQMKRRQKVLLPSTDDIRKLHSYISTLRKEAMESLQRVFSLKVWHQLAETTLMSIQLFNRRRAGEVERILIEDFICHQGINEETDNDLFKSLNSESRQIAKKYVRFTIRGKLNRTVPVLLDSSLLKCVKLLLKNRGQANVKDENPYVFGIEERLDREFKYLRACNLMRKFSEHCGASHPERLRGTNLRKHIATTCITLNLEEQEVSDLANFMGHAEKIHKDIYRQPVLSRDILRMSRLLEAAQGASSGSENEDDQHEGVHIPENDRIRRPPSNNDSDSESDVETFIRKPSKKITLADAVTPKKKKRSTSPYGSVKRTRWTDEEKEVIFREFAREINNRTLPSLQKIQMIIRENPAIQERTSPQIKTWIHNQFKK